MIIKKINQRVSMRTHLINIYKTNLNHFINPKTTGLRFYNTKMDPNKINSEFKKPNSTLDVEKSIKDLQLEIKDLQLKIKKSDQTSQNELHKVNKKCEKLDEEAETASKRQLHVTIILAITCVLGAIKW